MRLTKIVLVALLSSTQLWALPTFNNRIPLPRPLVICRVLAKTYYVNQNYRGTSDGSPQAPFNTLNQALASASNQKVCNLDIQMADGSYGENLLIDRNTNINALANNAVIIGSISNTSGSTLKLNRIKINSASGIGINQVGGTLEMSNSSILWTKAGTNVLSGTGLALSGSARAILTSVEVSMNSDRGIFISDNDSILWATHLIVNRNGNQGIEITNSAKAFLNDISVEENIKVGLFISNRAKVNIQNSMIRFSKFVTPNNWGSNIAITNNAILDILNFNIYGAQGAGVVFDNAFFTASVGQIQNNATGIAYFNTTYNVADCIADNVAFIGNGSKVGSGQIPLPSNQPQHCARVPWETP